MNPDLAKLQPYPFERLTQLTAGVRPPAQLQHIALSIGEPKHPTPALIGAELIDHLGAWDAESFDLIKKHLADFRAADEAE